VLGRDASCELTFAEGSISRRHARLIYKDGDWQLIDMESRNGLFFHEARVPSCTLQGGEEVRLGKLRLRFHLDSGEDYEGKPSGSGEAGNAEDLTTMIHAQPTDAAPRVSSSGLASERRAAHLASLQQGPRQGWLGGDLSQRSALVRWSVYLLVLLVAVGACAGAFMLVQALRG